jgi:hypothetical protein
LKQEDLMTTATPGSSTSTLTINIFDGTRAQLKSGINVLYRIFDGNQNPVRVNEISNPSVRFPDLPFYDNFGDNYRVVVWADGYYTAGFVPVPLSPSHPVELKLMLLPKKKQFQFLRSRLGHCEGGSAVPDKRRQRFGRQEQVFAINGE